MELTDGRSRVENCQRCGGGDRDRNSCQNKYLQGLAVKSASLRTEWNRSGGPIAASSGVSTSGGGRRSWRAGEPENLGKLALLPTKGARKRGRHHPTPTVALTPNLGRGRGLPCRPTQARCHGRTGPGTSTRRPVLYLRRCCHRHHPDAARRYWAHHTAPASQTPWRHALARCRSNDATRGRCRCIFQ